MQHRASLKQEAIGSQIEVEELSNIDSPELTTIANVASKPKIYVTFMPIRPDESSHGQL